MVVDTGCRPLMIRSPEAGRRRLFSIGSSHPHNVPLPIDPEVGDIVFIRVTVRPFLEVASATRSWANHVGIVVGERGGEPLIAESTFPLSRVTTMSRFLARSRARCDADRARRYRDLRHAAAPESRSSARLLEDLVLRPDSVAPPHGDAGEFAGERGGAGGGGYARGC